MICSPMTSDAVAAGDGALRTCSTRPSLLRENSKSSASRPSEWSAWARTPLDAGSRSWGSMPGTRRDSEAATSAAESLFRQALTLDPNYALAHAYMASAYTRRSVGAKTHSEEQMQYDSAVARAKHAIELDRQLTRGQEARPT